MMLGIQPVAAYPRSGLYLWVNDGRIELEVGVSFAHTLIDVSGNPVSLTRREIVQSSTYSSWTGADTYIAASIATQVGLTPLSGFY